MSVPVGSTDISPETLVGRIAVERPASIPVFLRLGIDFCCGGAATLADAVERADARLDEVLGELLALSVEPPEQDWSEASLPELLDHIVSTHHVFTKNALSGLWGLLTKVIQAHGDNHPELHDGAKVIAAMFTEIGRHMQKEEQFLFPHIRALAASPGEPGVVPEVPMHVMEQEHDHVASAFRQLHEITRDFQAPKDACDSYRSLYAGLAQLERDLHVHIHLENNILHPRTRALVK